MRTKLSRLAFLLLICLLVPAGFNPAAEQQNATLEEPKVTAPAKTTVALTIDFADGAQKRYPSVPWKKGMTVLDSLQWASKHPHGIELKSRGKGALAMVLQIDDLKNGGGNGKNWIFYSNEKQGKKSCGAVVVQQGAEILWRYEVYR